MASFYRVTLENAPLARLRLLEHVQRLLEDQDVHLVGTIAANLMIDVILVENPEGDLAKVDSFIDDLAEALKTSTRECLEMRKHTH